jgi:hypothetical protein
VKKNKEEEIITFTMFVNKLNNYESMRSAIADLIYNMYEDYQTGLVVAHDIIQEYYENGIRK